MRIVVNTISTKKAAGGAYQIAHNFIKETLNFRDVDWYYLTSSDVDESVGELFKDQKNKTYFVYPTQPDFNGTYRQVKKDLIKWEETYYPDVIYTISSPCYFTFKTKEVMRFANAWITNPNQYAWHALSLKAWLRMRLYRINQFRLLRKAKYFITQSETVGEGLVKKLGLKKECVKIVPNVLPIVYKAIRVEKTLDSKYVDIACIAAPFPHKNLGIIPQVLRSLRDCFGITNVRFHLTIPNSDSTYIHILLDCRKYGVEYGIVNHGRCTQEQLGSIYNKCMISFLPSLLETFSATSLEAMYFGLLIVAAEFDFNKEIIRDAGLYFSPNSAKDAAEKIVEMISNHELQKDFLIKMKQRLTIYDDYDKHFNDIKDFLIKVGKGII